MKQTVEWKKPREAQGIIWEVSQQSEKLAESVPPITYASPVRPLKCGKCERTEIKKRLTHTQAHVYVYTLGEVLLHLK